MADRIELNPQASSSVVDWILSNRLKAIGYTWLAGVSGSLAYQWSRPIPTSLKIIHSRVYAQAITLGALGVVATMELYTQSNKSSKEQED